MSNTSGLRQAQTSKAGREQGNVPGEACFVRRGGTQTSLQGAPYGSVMRCGILGDEVGRDGPERVVRDVRGLRAAGLTAHPLQLGCESRTGMA